MPLPGRNGISCMSEEDPDDKHITRRELEAFKGYLDEKFKSQNNRTLLYVGLAAGLIRFDVPKEVGALAVLFAIAKGAVALIHR